MALPVDLNPPTVTPAAMLPVHPPAEECDDVSTIQKIYDDTGRPILESISGFTDYQLSDHYTFGHMLETVKRVYTTYGFTHFHSRPFERAENLLLKGGIGKQIFGVFSLADGSLTRLALPFDRTVPLALFVATRGKNMPFPYRRADIAYSYRGEKAQPGRFRAFYQADVDIIGPNLGLMNDFECLSAMLHALEELNVGPFRMVVNHIQIAKTVISQFHIPEEMHPEVLRIVDKMDKLSQAEVASEMKRLLPTMEDSTIEQLIDAFSFRGDPVDFHLKEENAREALNDVKTLHGMLVDAGIPRDRVVFSPGLVRGLDYYTGIVFETFIEGLEKFGSIASGGRYSQLVGVFNPQIQDIEGVGGSIGLTRLYDILTRENRIERSRLTVSDVLVCYRRKELISLAGKVTAVFRKQGIPTELYSGDKSRISSQLDFANKVGIPFAVMVMDVSAIVVKDLAKEEKESPSKQVEVESAEKALAIFQQFQLSHSLPEPVQGLC